jgi:2-polyprenyl-3-methyl-5-hydroxy-6-metoxy-1,4-benzoquinol methylase
MRDAGVRLIEDREIASKIASFPDWHYDFDLRGHHTCPASMDKANQRVAHFLEPVIKHFGGSLEGKRVLDLGCNAGFFSLKAIEAGCDFVLGIDGRQMHVDQANLVFEVKQVDPRRYHFACANILDFDYAQGQPFDLVLCLGVLYHINKPISLFEAIAPVNTDMLVIDTKISTLRGSVIELRRDDLGNLKDAVDYELVMVPTAEAVIEMAELFGYQAKMLSPAEARIPGMGKYRYGLMKTFVCAKASNLSRSSAFNFQTIKALYKDQELGTAVRGKTLIRNRRNVIRRGVSRLRRLARSRRTSAGPPRAASGRDSSPT